MPGARYKKCRPPMRKVTYIEVKRKRGVFWKEVDTLRKAGSSNYTGTPSTAPRQHPNCGAVDDYLAWNDIPIDLPRRSKVRCIHLVIWDIYNNRKQTQNDYIREWLPRRRHYLDTIIGMDGRDVEICTSCGQTEGTWRCIICTGWLVLCSRSCCEVHQRAPFHRVEQGTGTHWEVFTVPLVFCTDLHRMAWIPRGIG